MSQYLVTDRSTYDHDCILDTDFTYMHTYIDVYIYMYAALFECFNLIPFLVFFLILIQFEVGYKL